jgi:hypothetical protein
MMPHEAQAIANHGQTLSQLDSRGGLAPSEMLAVVEDRRFAPMDEDVAIDKLVALVAAGVWV